MGAGVVYKHLRNAVFGLWEERIDSSRSVIAGSVWGSTACIFHLKHWAPLNHNNWVFPFDSNKTYQIALLLGQKGTHNTICSQTRHSFIFCSGVLSFLPLFPLCSFSFPCLSGSFCCFPPFFFPSSAISILGFSPSTFPLCSGALSLSSAP